MRVVLILPPIIQIVIFGFAVNLDVNDATLGWMDFDQTCQPGIEGSFDGSPNFRVIKAPRNDQEIKELLDRGRVMAVVRVLPGFDKDIKRGDASAVQILVEGRIRIRLHWSPTTRRKRGALRCRPAC
ncbi:MAG: hypothetical protein U0V70_03650 [Terriglobia bacterium]